MIYFLQRSDGAIKIGTTNNYHARLAQLTAIHGDLQLLGLLEGAYEREQWLHLLFSRECIDDRKEWFSPSRKLLDYIKENTHLDVSLISVAPKVSVGEGRLRNRFAVLIKKKAEREGRYLTQQIIAQEIGVSQTTVSRWLNEKVDRYDANTLEKFCRYLGVNIGGLVYLELDENNM